ncbi:MAG TPA: hypothetical protein VGR36_06125 [Candidatus Acidoferrales bacterium]|nr:hypothetical protein [Candidatus Acidoferrales bacterium]
MQISFGTAVIKSRTKLVFLAAILLASCSSPAPDHAPVIKADKPFATAGSVEMKLDSGDYRIRAGSDERIRVTFAGNIGNAVADLATNGSHATLEVRDTPHRNFRATVEVPATANLTIHLAAGNLDVGAITGNKDIDSQAGNVTIATPTTDDYATVDAAVKIGNLDAGPFGASGSGFSRQLKWSGHGKFTLHASLGAGNLELKH